MAFANDVRPEGTKVKINSKTEVELIYTLNDFIELEKKYGSIDKAMESLGAKDGSAFVNLRYFLWVGIRHNENADVTEEQVGAVITINNMGPLMEAVTATMTDTMGKDLLERLPGNPEAQQ